MVRINNLPAPRRPQHAESGALDGSSAVLATQKLIVLKLDTCNPAPIRIHEAQHVGCSLFVSVPAGVTLSQNQPRNVPSVDLFFLSVTQLAGEQHVLRTATAIYAPFDPSPAFACKL